MVNRLEAEPESPEVQQEINDTMVEMVKDDQFKVELEKWVKECQKPFPTMKNVLEDVNIEVQGNINIGDKSGNEVGYDQKNVVKRGTIVGGGDFNLGDTN